MKTKEEIRQALLDYLKAQESGKWSEVSSSLVGRELLSYGAEVINVTENLADSIMTSLDYNKLTASTAINLSRLYRVPLTFNKPAYIQVQLLGGTSVAAYKPFELRISKGGALYTNISACQSTDKVTLYQGEIHEALSDGQSQILPISNVQSTLYKARIISLTTNQRHTGHVIGEGLPQSVHVFYYDKDTGASSIATEYKPWYASTDHVLFLQYVLSDRRIMVCQGEKEWSKVGDYNYQILWLKPTDVNVDTDNIKVQTADGVDVTFNLLDYANAEFDSVSYAREYINAAHLEMTSLSSRSQLETYVTAQPSVHSCYASTLGTNSIVVYCKPSTDGQSAESLNELSAVVQERGNLGFTYSIIQGNRLDFDIIISTGSVLTNEEKQFISTLLSEYFSWDNLSIGQGVNLQGAASYVFTSTGKYVTLTLKIKSTSQLAGAIVQHTIRLLKDGNYVGFDNRGHFIVGPATPALTTTIYCCSGNLLLGFHNQAYEVHESSAILYVLASSIYGGRHVYAANSHYVAATYSGSQGCVIYKAPKGLGDCTDLLASGVAYSWGDTTSNYNESLCSDIGSRCVAWCFKNDAGVTFRVVDFIKGEGYNYSWTTDYTNTPVLAFIGGYLICTLGTSDTKAWCLTDTDSTSVREGKACVLSQPFVCFSGSPDSTGGYGLLKDTTYHLVHFDSVTLSGSTMQFNNCTTLTDVFLNTSAEVCMKHSTSFVYMYDGTDTYYYFIASAKLVDGRDIVLNQTTGETHTGSVDYISGDMEGVSQYTIEAEYEDVSIPSDTYPVYGSSTWK